MNEDPILKKPKICKETQRTNEPQILKDDQISIKPNYKETKNLQRTPKFK